jgi:hypothetical protein
MVCPVTIRRLTPFSLENSSGLEKLKRAVEYWR